jgi:aminoglycoside 6-adenylyltransferase
MNHERVVAQLAAWAHDDDNIRAAVLTGSLARGEGDDLSDVDIELFVLEAGSLLNNDDWYRDFGDVLVVEALANRGWNPTRLVYYVDGKIDFTIMSCGDARRSDAAQRTARVLVDKDTMLDDLVLDVIPPAEPPTQGEFETCVNWFYAAAIMGAKMLVRNELWSAKFRDFDAKAQLLGMIELDHKSRHGWSYDTWHNASHIDRWMDADVIAELQACWSGLDADASASALLATISLFDRMTVRTAGALDLQPFDTRAAHAEVERVLSQRHPR